jgi:hypothetical protein
MASTRNKNTPGNYHLEQNQNKDFKEYNLYQNSSCGEAYKTNFAGNGLNQGRMPYMKLSQNGPDIESFLFGINSTNLVNPAPVFVPKINQLQQAHIFDKEPVFIPEPLVIERNQRPTLF